MTTDPQMCPNFPHGPRNCDGVARQAGSDYTCTFCFEQRKRNESDRSSPVLTDIAIIPSQDAARPAVALVTALAEAGDLSADEYRVIYDQVAAGRSLRNVELALRSRVTFGWWAKYAAGEKGLDRERKNELRAWARANGGPDLPELPPTPVEAVAAHVHPDAAVYRIGEQIASRVILIGSDIAATNLRINGACSIVSAAPVLESHQPACNSRYTRPPRASIHLRPDTWQRLNSARQRAGLTWDQFLARLED